MNSCKSSLVNTSKAIVFEVKVKVKVKVKDEVEDEDEVKVKIRRWAQNVTIITFDLL